MDGHLYFPKENRCFKSEKNSFFTLLMFLNRPVMDDHLYFCCCNIFTFDFYRLLILSCVYPLMDVCVPSCPCGSTEEHLTTDQGVAGSNPATDAFPKNNNFNKKQKKTQDSCP
eukprot:Tbor_TRINITY_DN5598_c1_g3::TRINITY_DN5598_c1_g3_i3::g.12519::m.12519